MNIGNVLKKLREHKACSQKTIANFLLIERSTYARIEDNQTQLTITLAEKIAKFYGMELDYFVRCLQYPHFVCNSTTLRLINLQKDKERLASQSIERSIYIA